MFCTSFATGEASSYTTTATTHNSENAILDLMTALAITPLIKAVQLVTPSTQITGEYAHLFAVTISTILHSFLDTLLDAKMMIDEAGLYKLFRILLKLQEQIATIKSMLNFGTEKQLLDEVSAWIRAQEVINIINETIFEVVGMSKRESKSQVQGGNSAIAPTSQLNTSNADGYRAGNKIISEEEKICWKNLAFLPSNSTSGFVLLRYLKPARSYGGCFKKRHKGTVFISLTINLHNL